MKGYWPIAGMTDVSQMLGETHLKGARGFSDINLATREADDRIDNVVTLTVKRSLDREGATRALEAGVRVEEGTRFAISFGTRKCPRGCGVGGTAKTGSHQEVANAAVFSESTEWFLSKDRTNRVTSLKDVPV